MRLCLRAFRGEPFHAGLPLALLRIQEREVQDLTLLIEAKAGYTPRETFLPLLVLRPVLLEAAS